MKKYTQIFAVLIVFTLLVIAKQGLSTNEIANRFGGDDDNRPVVAPSGLTMASPTSFPSPTPATTPNPTISPTLTPTPTPKPSPKGQYKDGTYTGSVADAYYGYVQVQAIIAGGKITDVKFLQHPNDNRTSQRINDQAMPYLTQEAIQAQNANVNTISGASATSGAFVESLKSALRQAV